MPPRMANPPSPPTVPVPKNPVEWNRLMQTVIARAEELGHRHLPGLRASMAKGEAEKHLRSLGIIHPADIDREFPPPR